MTFALSGEGMPIFPGNARVVLRRESGEALFTGYVTAAPTREYLGWGQVGQVYRYAIEAIGDEAKLDREVLAQRPPMVMKTSGEIVRKITETAAPGEFDLSEVGDGDMITQISTSLKKWSEC